MKNLLKNRIVVGLFCIILSLIICFGLTPMFNNALTSTVEIVRVKTDIIKGDLITKDMLTTVEAGGYNLPSGIVYNADDVIGKYANADLYKDDYILQSKLSDTAMLKNDYLSGLNGENRAISITIKSFAAGLSGKLEPGDIVTLIAGSVGQMRETLIPPELQYVQIIATTIKNGTDRNVQSDDTDDGLASTITVLVSPEQARLLAELEQDGTLHAALVYRGDSETAQMFLDAQAAVLEELYADEPVETESDGENTEDGEARPENPDAETPPADSDTEGGEAE